MTNKIEISKEEYIRLHNAANKFYCLECGGVDNWTFYGESLYPDDGEHNQKIVDIEVNGDGSIKEILENNND